MNTLFDICGTIIKFESIKTFRLVQVEYIYRPIYKEREAVMKMFSSKKYEFYEMAPYAAIAGENGHKSDIAEYQVRNLKSSFIKEIGGALVTELGDKLNIKALKYSKYICVNAAGRVFETYLKDVPAQLIRSDGKHSEVYPNDKLFPLLGEEIAPSIEMIPALIIDADQKYVFYGNGIQVNDAVAQYNRLKLELSNYMEEVQELKQNPKGKLEGGSKIKKLTDSKVSLPKINFQFGKQKDKIPVTGENDLEMIEEKTENE